MKRDGCIRAAFITWTLLVAACGTPRIAGNKTFSCLCNCLICDFRDLFTDECLSEHTVIFNSRSCADDPGEGRDACETACNEDSLGGQCGAQVVSQVANSCLLHSPARPLAVQAPDAARAVIDPARSSVFVTLTSDGTMGDTTASGDIWIRGGDCALGSQCPVEITWMSLDMLPLSFGDHTAVDVHIDNNGKQPGMRLASGAYLLAPLTASFNARGVLDGTFVSGEAVAGAPVSGELKFTDGTMTLAGTFFSEDGTILVDLLLVANFVNQPPKADAGADQVAECGARIGLDGTRSVDPDGAIVQFSWYETAKGPQNPFTTGVSPTVNLDPGNHPITLRVRDDDDSMDTDQTVVTVVDTTGPTITGVTVDPGCLWPPNHKLVRLDLGSNIIVKADDACTAVTSIKIVGVTSNEPIDALGDGSTAPDVTFGTNAVCLRSERSGNGDGRVYTITVEATDANGNISQANVEVPVAHDRGHGHSTCGPLPPSDFLDDGDPACSFPAVRDAPKTSVGGCGVGGGQGAGSLLLLVAWLAVPLVTRRR